MDLQKIVSRSRIEARPYQLRIVQQVLESFSGARSQPLRKAGPQTSSIMVESPTGSGKTCMALLAAKALQQAHDIKVGWVAMRRYLLHQAADENGRLQINVGPMSFISMFDKDPPTTPDLLVVDECVHDATASMAHLHNVIQPRWILGLTAVPFRADRIKLCFDKVIRDAGIHALIEEGYLSPYEHFTIPDFNVETVAEFYLREPQRWGKSVVFFRTLRECHRFQEILRSHQVSCEVVSASSDRERQLEDFHADAIQVLANCMILTEGFDCPNLQTVFCRDSSKGPTVQMCGRVLRKYPDLPAKNIVQSTLTRWPFTKVARPAQQWLWQSDEWRSLNVNPLIDVASAQARMAIAHTQVELPQLLAKRGANENFPQFIVRRINSAR